MGAVNPTTFSILTYRAFEPTEISGLKAWYDASTIDQADGTNVSAWLDSSGNEAHMYQSTTSAQPTLQTNELNGRAVVRFDGTDDFMNLTAPFDVLPNNVPSVNANTFSNNGNYLICSNGSTSPYVVLYKKNGNVFNKMTNLGSFTGTASYQPTFNIDDTYLQIGSNASPYLHIYKRTDDSFSKLSNPATLPNGAVVSSHFSSDSTYLAVCGSFTGRLSIYKRSLDTFTILTAPATIPTGSISRSVMFSPDDSFLAVADSSSPYILFYSRSGDVFTKLTNPTTLPTSGLNSLNWLNSTTCAVGQDASNTILIYQYNGSSKFELLTSFNVTGATGINSLRYSNSKNYLAVAHNATNYFTVYSISGTTYTAISNPASLPISTGRGVAWGLNDTSLVVSHTNSPFIQAYTFDGTTLTNLTKLNMFRNVGGASVFAVVKYTLSGTEHISFFSSVGTSTDTRFSLSRNPTFKLVQNVRALDSDTNPQNLSTQSIDGFSYYIHSAFSNFNLREHRQYINNFLDGSKDGITTAGNTSNTDSRNILLGRLATGASYLNGDIAEIIVFNRALTTQEIKNVHYYLAQKYNISVPL
jgi:6-phosphogluconolactonase (cycloisomerase 2 family)